MKLQNLIWLGLALTPFFLSLSLSAAGNFPARVQAATYAAPADDSAPDFHIDKDGNISVHQAKVMQVAGTSFYTRYYVGLAFIRMLVKTDSNTKVYRRFGDEIDLNQIAVGDMLNIEGQIESGADSLSVVASKLTDFSNQKQISDFKGVIVGTGPVAGSFILFTKIDTVTIHTSTTTQIKKGSRIIPPALVQNGDMVVNTAGTYDHATKILDANVVVIYIDKNIFLPRNFEGVLKTVSPNNASALTITTEGKDYSVMLSGNTAVLNKRRKPVSIKRYLEGDTVRIYGAIREAEEPIIDAEILRNTSLQ